MSQHKCIIFISANLTVFLLLHNKGSITHHAQASCKTENRQIQTPWEFNAINLHCSFIASNWASFLSSRALSLTFSAMSFWTSASFCIFSPSKWVVLATSLFKRQKATLHQSRNILPKIDVSRHMKFQIDRCWARPMLKPSVVIYHEYIWASGDGIRPEEC